MMPADKSTRNKVYMDQDLLWVCVVGNQTGESVRKMGEQLQDEIARLRQEQKPVLIFDDLTNIGEATSEAVKNVAILARLLDYDRAAMVDNRSAFMQATVNLLLKSVGRNDARYFSDASAAKAWLRKP